MRTLKTTQAMANQPLLCPFCEEVIGAGELFWRVFDESDRNLFVICRKHVPLNTRNLIGESAIDGSAITSVRSDALDIRREIIPKLLSDWNNIYSLTPEEFEELVFDRLLAMELQPFRMGPANQKDGGIDIVFWTNGALPILGAVQVKHHRKEDSKTGSEDVQKLKGAMDGYHFNLGLLITNTSFTSDAEHQAQKESSVIQLRDGAALKKWVAEDFVAEKLNVVTRTIEFCRGRQINVPHFF
jgi:HJR/Mrr/RecB family endonuclease